MSRGRKFPEIFVGLRHTDYLSSYKSSLLFLCTNFWIKAWLGKLHFLLHRMAGEGSFVCWRNYSKWRYFVQLSGRVYILTRHCSLVSRGQWLGKQQKTEAESENEPTVHNSEVCERCQAFRLGPHVMIHLRNGFRVISKTRMMLPTLPFGPFSSGIGSSREHCTNTHCTINHLLIHCS